MTAAPLDTAKFAPTVAGQDPYQTQAYTFSSWSRYWCLSTLHLTQAGAYTGPGSQAAFMSPYQTPRLAAGSFVSISATSYRC